jgi:hypothetical protein
MTDENTISSYEKGSWQEKMGKSATLLDRSTKARKQASALLWQGAVEGIEGWLPNASTDVSAEGFYGEVLDILGTPRKGDASKIKTVALAVKNNGLVLSVYPNLSKAYAEATRLTKTVAQEKDEDDAAEKAIAAIDAPKTTGSIEGAAALLLSKGVDGAVVAILDALGANNEAAHRAFMRAVSTEIAARVQAAKPKPAAQAGPKAGATQATKGKAGAKATVKDGTTKAKPAPVSKSKGDPNAKALPPKAKPVAQTKPSEPVTEPVHVGDDTPDHTDAEAQSAPVKKTVARPVKRAVPVRRGA